MCIRDRKWAYSATVTRSRCKRIGANGAAGAPVSGKTVNDVVDVHHTVRPEHDSHLWGADRGVQDRVAGQQPSKFKNSRKRTRHVLGSSNSCCVIAVCFSSGMQTRARKAPTPSGM